MSFKLESFVEADIEQIQQNLKMIEARWEQLHSRIQKAKAEVGKSEQWTSAFNDGLDFKMSTVEKNIPRVSKAFNGVRVEIEFVPEPD